MNDRDYERMARRKRTQRKSLITTIIAGVIIVAAVIAIIVVIVSLIKKNSPAQDAPESTIAATEQPTLYLPTEQGAATPTSPAATTAQTPTATETATESAPIDPGAATEPDPQTPIDPGAVDYPTEAPYVPDNTGSSYTDDSGVLHIFTPSGYNWTYYSDGVSVKITCQPHYDEGQFEFLITGQIPGETQFNVYYYTDEEKKSFVKVPVTAVVNDDLSVTRID